MDAKYKILFSGEFKLWVQKDGFIDSFSQHLAAFEKMGVLVTKRLMLKPFVGPHIEQESRIEHLDNGESLEELVDSDEGSGSGLYPSMIQQGKKGWSNLTRTLKLLENKTDS